MKLSRVHPSEWVAGLCGALILVSLFMPWYGDESAFASVGPLDLILAFAGLVGLLMPFIVARSRFSNVPVVSETLISELAMIVTLILLLRLIWPLEGGFKAGYFLGLAGAVLLTVSGWKSTARES